MRQVLIYPGEDGYWVAEVPSLPGCISQGKTRKEALINAKEAVDAYINALKEDGLSVPEERFEALLERIAIFRCLNPTEAKALAQVCRLQVCERGDTVFVEGSRAKEMSFVALGTLPTPQEARAFLADEIV